MPDAPKKKVWNEAEFTLAMRDPAGDIEPEYDVDFNIPFYHIKTDDGKEVIITIDVVRKMGEHAEAFHKKHFKPFPSKQKH
jgi:hypothetical protein